MLFRIMSKPIYPENPYSFIGVCRLAKDAKFVQTKDGNRMWTGYVQCEERPKQYNDNRAFMNINIYNNAKKDGNLADKMVEWEKGTILLIGGGVIRDEYWTKQTGVESYKLIGGFVLLQPDYAEAMRASSGTPSEYERGTASKAGNDEFFEDSGYDPGF